MCDGRLAHAGAAGSTCLPKCGRADRLFHCCTEWQSHAVQFVVPRPGRAGGARDVGEGEQATRVPQLGICNYSEPLYW